MGQSRANAVVSGKTVSAGGRHAEGGRAVLLTCIGRRVSLLNAFRRAAQGMRPAVRFYGTDASELSPALQSCDDAFLVEPTTHPRYIDQLLSLVGAHRVGLLVPTVDLDLRRLAQHRERFEELGCRVLVSSSEVIDICQDKRRTYGFLRHHGFDTPVTRSIRAALAADRRGELTWPCFLKPWDGHAGKGSTVVCDRKELLYFAKRTPNAMCQELVNGTEYTCDVYVDFEMRVRCVVPRRRLEVRSGEVSKARTVKHVPIMQEAARLVELLGAGPGVITLQLFETPQSEIKFIEINPRFGGGAPLSIRAGADFPKWILHELTGKPPHIDFDAFQDGLIMLRYDAEVWLTDSEMKGTKV